MCSKPGHDNCVDYLVNHISVAISLQMSILNYVMIPIVQKLGIHILNKKHNIFPPKIWRKYFYYHNIGPCAEIHLCSCLHKTFKNNSNDITIKNNCFKSFEVVHFSSRCVTSLKSCFQIDECRQTLGST
jgi:hypothetical protein